MKLEEILATPGWSKSDDFEDLSEGSERPWYVYRHVSPSGKSYAGYSQNPIKRWTSHCEASRSKKHPDYPTKFKKAIRKYGSSKFLHEIIYIAGSLDTAKILEIQTINRLNLFKLGYNSTGGGDGRSSGAYLSKSYIMERAIEHKSSCGKWPTVESGNVDGGNPGDTWRGYDSSLRYHGSRGLPGGMSLAQLLAENTDYINNLGKPKLTEGYILDRAREFYATNLRWPNRKSGPVIKGHEGDTWAGYHSCLKQGNRGLAKGSSLQSLLEGSTAYVNFKNKPELTEGLILSKAKIFFEYHGRWPTVDSGAVDDSNCGDRWSTYHMALRRGTRGLPGGSSLAKLLDTIRKPKPSQT